MIKRKSTADHVLAIVDAKSYKDRLIAESRVPEELKNNVDKWLKIMWRKRQHVDNRGENFRVTHKKENKNDGSSRGVGSDR